MLIGVNLSHDYAHCVLAGGNLTLIEEERRSRNRYHWDDSSYTLACLDGYDLEELSEVEAIFFNSPHTAKISRRDGDLSSPKRDYQYSGEYPGPSLGEEVADGELLVEGLRIPAGWVSHYHAHAVSAHWSSTFPEADVFCLDGGGDFGEGAIFVADQHGQTLRRRLLETQLGSSYHHFALRVFRSKEGFFESKTMAVAGFGRPELSETSYLSRRGTLNAIEASARPSVHDVAEFQRRFEDEVLELIRGFKGVNDSLCLAGGCFYNVPLNRRIVESGLYEKVFVPPFAGDMGTAIGAVLLAAARTGHPLPVCDQSALAFLGDDISLQVEDLLDLVTAQGDVPVLHGLDDEFIGWSEND